MSTQAEIVEKHKALYERAGAVGLTLKTMHDSFEFTDVPGSKGIILFGSLEQVEIFIRGYELGYKSGL